MRVVLLVTDLQPGGTPLRIARLARGLRDAGLQVTVGCLACPGPVSARLAAAGIATFACRARRRGDSGALARLARHIRRIRPDLIHATLTHANVAARLVGAACGVPVLSSTATIEVERVWHLWLERLTGRLDRGHVVNSRALVAHVRRSLRLPARHVHLIPPSIGAVPRRVERDAARRQYRLGQDEFVVLWVGRFDPAKRLHIAVACAEALRHLPARLLLVGDGPYRPALERLVGLSSASRSIHLLGWQDDLGPAMSAADALLFPSLTEGLPNAVLEAMAFGLPVVGSDIPALRELAGADLPAAAPSARPAHGRPGAPRLLLVAGSEPRAYADALLRLRRHPACARALARRAAAWARENLDPSRTVAALIAVYQRVLGRPPAGTLRT